MILQRTQSRDGRWRSLTALTLLLGMWGSADLSAREEKRDDVKVSKTLPIVSESKAMAMLREATSGNMAGARQMLAQKEVMELTPEKVRELILGNNLTLAQQRHRVESAKQGIDVADASFLPVINASVNYVTRRSNGREDVITRLREVPKFAEQYTYDGVVCPDQAQCKADYTAQEAKRQSALENGAQDPGNRWDTTTTLSSIACVNDDTTGTEVNSDVCRQNLAVSSEVEAATYDSNWYDVWSGMGNVSKLFPWGGSVNAQVNTTYIPRDYVKSATVGSMRTAVDLGEDEWYSSGTVGFRSPVPFTKNFGERGNFPAVQSNLSRINSQTTQLLQEVTANSVLRSGLLSYWEVVRSLLQVEVASHYRQTMAKNLERVQRLFEGGQATEYSLLQARAGVENARDQEEIAWHNVVIRQNNLIEVLNLPAKVVVVPQGFETGLLDKAKVDGSQLLEKALTERPEILVAKSDVDSKDLLLVFRKNQLLPDFGFNASVSVGQSSTIYGYDSIVSSLGNLLHPDSMNYYVGVTLNIPWGDNKVRSEYTQARASQVQAQDNQRLVEVSVTSEANSALASYRSALSRETLALTNLRLAQETLASGERQSELGMVTDFELIQRNQDVFNAQADYVNALLDQRATYVSLLAASGDLGKSAATVVADKQEGGQP